MMPFGVFFTATFIGKAIIRNGYQSLMYITICTESHLQRMILLLQRLLPDSLGYVPVRAQTLLLTAVSCTRIHDICVSWNSVNPSLFSRLLLLDGMHRCEYF